MPEASTSTPPAAKRQTFEAHNEEPIDVAPISSAPPASREPEASATPTAASSQQENPERSLIVFTPPSKAIASACTTPIIPTPQSPPPPVITETKDMDEDVDIGDMGTPRIVDEAYELEHKDSPTNTMFSLEPHSPTITEVLPNTTPNSEDSVDASIHPAPDTA